MSEKILLIDDDVSLLQAISELLRCDGYTVAAYSDSMEALEYFRQNDDLMCILTDIDMPGMDGISLVAELRRMRPAVDTIFMTGGARRVGPFEEVLQKPFTFGELIQALENVRLALRSQPHIESHVASA
jgi:CheY-like chemotaxis protein